MPAYAGRTSVSSDGRSRPIRTVSPNAGSFSTASVGLSTRGVRHARRLDIEPATKPPRSTGDQLEEIGQRVMKAQEGVNEMADAGNPIVLRLEKADIRKMIHVRETTTRLAGFLAIDLTCAVPTAYFDNIRALVQHRRELRAPDRRRASNGRATARRTPWRIRHRHRRRRACKELVIRKPRERHNRLATKPGQAPAQRHYSRARASRRESTRWTTARRRRQEGSRTTSPGYPVAERGLHAAATAAATGASSYRGSERSRQGHRRGRIRQYAPASGPTSRTASGSPTTRRPGNTRQETTAAVTCKGTPHHDHKTAHAPECAPAGAPAYPQGGCYTRCP